MNLSTTGHGVSPMLSDGDRARTIEVGVGSLVTVRLTESPTTGYRWTVEATGGLEPLGDRFEEARGAIGATGLRVFQFRAARPGSHQIRMRKRREWEGSASVIDRFEATVIVK